MLSLKQERERMALDHFFRAQTIDEAIRTLTTPWTYEALYPGAEQREHRQKQLMVGRLISEGTLTLLRDGLIERGIELWESSREGTRSSPMSAGPIAGQTQSLPEAGAEDGEGVAYAAGVRVDASDSQYSAQYNSQSPETVRTS